MEGADVLHVGLSSGIFSNVEVLLFGLVFGEQVKELVLIYFEHVERDEVGLVPFGKNLVQEVNIQGYESLFAIISKQSERLARPAGAIRENARVVPIHGRLNQTLRVFKDSLVVLVRGEAAVEIERLLLLFVSHLDLHRLNINYKVWVHQLLRQSRPHSTVNSNFAF